MELIPLVVQDLKDTETGRTDVEQSAAYRAMHKADIWLLVGSIVCGTVVLAPVGLLIIVIGMVKLHRAGQLGWVRPMSVSLLAVFALVDGGYYVDYNSGPIGGIADNGEKPIALFAVLCIFPARAAAAWGFLKLKRWGLRWMKITGWAYMFLWIGYLFNIMADFPHRIGASTFGVTGWWIFDIFYLTPFIQLPWLYALDKRRWNK
jgi:hypothetical protein